MPLSVKKGTVAVPTSTGNQAISGAGFQPKVVLFFLTRAVADGFTTPAAFGLGAATSSSARKAISVAADHNAADSNTARRQANLAVTLLGNATPTVLCEADLVSLDSDGFTLNWTTVGGITQPILHYLALGGTDLANAKVGEFTLPTTTNSSFGVTGVGFQPDAIMLYGVRDDTALPVNSTQASFFVGAASSATSRACVSFCNQDAQATTVLARFLTASKVIHELTNGGGLRAEADLVSLDSDGFTLNVSTAPAVADRVFYVALEGNARFKVGVETQKTSTGTKATTGVGFKPGMLFMFGVNRVNGAGIDTSSAEMGFSMGAATASAESCAWIGGADAAATTDEASNQGEAKALRHANVPSTVDAEADLSSMDNDGFTLDWTTADATAREFVYLVAGGHLAAQAGQASETDLAQPVTARKTVTLGFASETDLAQPVTEAGGGAHVIPVGQANESNTVQAVGKLKVKTVGQPSETNTGFAVGRLKLRLVAQTTETNTPLPATVGKRKGVAQVLEVEAALGISRVKSRTVGQPVETDLAQALARAKRKTVGLAAEADTAISLVPFGAVPPPITVRTLSDPATGRTRVLTATGQTQAGTATGRTRTELGDS